MLTKRFCGKVLLWCMLLCVCLFGCAFAEDVTVEGENFNLLFDGGTEATMFVEGWNLSPFGITASWTGENEPSEYAPTWNLTMLSGTVVECSLMESDHFVELRFDSNSGEEGDVSFLLECTWDGETIAQELVIHFVALGDSLPEITNLPDSVTLLVNEEVSFEPTLTNSFETYGNECSWSTYRWASDGEWYSREDNGTYYHSFATPGYYVIGFTMNCGNLSLGRQVNVIVCADEAVMPEMKIDLGVEDELNFPVYVGATINSHRGIFIQNNDILTRFMGGYPTWNLTQISGVNGFIVNDEYPGNKDYTFSYHADPSVFTQEGTSVYLLECSWGDAYASVLMKAEATILEDMPTGLDYPEEIIVTAGEQISLTTDALIPADCSLLETYPCHMMLNGNEAFFERISDDSIPSVAYVCYTPGIYECVLEYIIADISVTKPITIRVADENGVVPEPEIILNCGESMDLVYYVGDWSHNPGDIYLNVQNWDYLYNLYGDYPEWSFEYTGNSRFLSYDTTDGARNELNFLNQPEEVGEGQILMTCTLGDLTATCTFNISVLPEEEAPTGLNLPDTVTVKAGETFTLGSDDLFQPDSYVAPENMDAYFSIMNFDYSYFSYVTYENMQSVISAHTPGVYFMEIYGIVSNVRLEKVITVIVTDEDGNYPEPAPAINIETIDHTLFVNGNSGHSWGIDISNYDSVKYWFDSDPEWTLTHLSGESDVVYLQKSDRTGFIWLECPGTATQLGDATYRLDCTWGDSVTSIDITIHVINFSPCAPTGLDIPSEITVQAGNTFTLPVKPGTLPEQVDIPNGMYSFSYLDSVSGNPYYENSEGDEYHTYVAVTPGIYETRFYYTLGNHRFEQPITIKIADENGVVPEPAINLSVSAVPNALFLDGNCTSMITMVDFTNYFALPDYGNVVWDLTVTGASENMFSFWGSDSYHYINLDRQPETAGDITIKVSCTYGDLYEECEVTIPVIDLGDSRPTGLNLPDEITFASGEQCTIQHSDIIPEVFAGIEYDSFYLSWNENVYSSSNGSEIVISSQTPGTYPIQVQMRFGNILLSDTFLVKVADTDGNVPPLVFELNNYNFSEKVDLFLGGNYLANLGEFYINNFDLLKEFIPGTPEWSLEVVNGDFRPFQLDSYNNNKNSAFLHMVAQPTEAGESTLRVLCTWGDYTVVREIALTIHGADAVLPTELILPDEITGQISEIIEFRPADILPSFDATSSEFEFRCYGSSYSYDDNGDVLKIFIHSNGIFAGEIIWHRGNLELQKDFILKIADQDGNVPELSIDLRQEETEMLFDLNGDLDREVGYFYINNSSLLHNLFGGASEWSLEPVSGSEDLLAMQPDGNSVSLVINENAALSTGDTTVRVHVTWGDLSASGEFTLHLVESEVAPSLTLPEEITVTTGEIFSLDAYQMMPEGWDDLDHAPWVNVIASDPDGFHYVNDSGIQPEFEAGLPGYYTMDIWWNWLNHEYHGRILLKVTEEDGSLPELDLGMSMNYYLDTDTLYIGGNSSVELCQYHISNFDLFESLYGGAPRWSFDAGEYTYMFDFYGGSEYHYIEMYDTPSEACDVTYTVTCTWGDYTYTDSNTIHFMDAGDLTPTGLEVPGTIRIKAGEWVEVPAPADIPLLPAGAIYPAGEPRTYFNTSYGLKTTWDGTTYSLSADDPGIYSLEYVWTHYNFRLSGLVVVEVEDENGNVPAPEPGLYTEGVWRTQYVGGNDLFLAEYYFNNGDLFYNVYGGQPTVTATCSDPAVQVYAEADTWSSPDYPYGYINLAEPLTTPGEYTVTLTAVWGDSITSTDFSFTVQESPCGIPESLNLPDEMTLTVGEIFSFKHNEVVNPVGWFLEDEWYDFWCSCSGNTLESWDGNNEETWFRANVPGVNYVTFILSVGNFQLEKDVLVTILDENGEIPLPELKVYANYATTRDVFLSGNSDIMHGFYIPYDVYESLKAIHGNEPIWSIANVEGDLNLLANPYDGNCNLEVLRTNNITALGATTAEVVCTWGDQEVRVPFTINVVPDPEVVPEYLELPDSITLKAGETFTFGRDMVRPETVDITPQEIYFGIGGNSALWNAFTTIYRDNYTETIKFTVPGVYEGYFHWEYANFSLSKRVIITVTDENGEVPVFEMSIATSYGDRNGQRDIFLSGNIDTVHSFYIPNQDFNTMQTLYGGAPTWSLSGVEGELNLALDTYNNGRNVSLIRLNDITALGATTGELICTWGDQVVTQPFCLNVVPDPAVIPEGIDVPDTFSIKVGETFTFGHNMFLPNDLDLSISDISFGIGGNDELWESLTYVGGSENEDIFQFSKPGIYTLDYHYSYVNFYIYKEVVVTVADENGDVPDLGLTIEERYGDENGQRDIFFSGNDGTVHGFSIPYETFNTLKAIYGGTPTWTLSGVEGELDLMLDIFNDDQYVNLIRQNDITSLGATTGELICTWGDQVVTQPFCINVVPDPAVIPEDVAMPGYFTIQVGETFTFGRDMLLPENLDFSYDEINWGIGGDSELWQSLSYVSGNEYEDTYVFSRPGLYRMHCHFNYVNFFIGKEVIVAVADENGTAPSLEFELNSSYPNDRILYLNGNTNHVQSVNIDWETYDQLSAIMPGTEPEWHLTVLEGDMNLSFDDYNRNIAIHSEDISSTGSTTARVDCIWGDLSASYTFTLTVADPLEIVPEYVDFPTRLDLTVGDTFAVPFTTDAILPAGSIPADATEAPSVGITGDEYVIESLDWVGGSNQALVYRVTQPGVLPINVFFNFSNFHGSRTCLLYVADENGEVPGPSVDLEIFPMTEDLTRTVYIGGNGWNLYNCSIDWNVAEILHEMYGQWPTWSYEVLEGMHPIAMGSGDTWADFYVDGELFMEDKIVVRVTCSCGDFSSSLDFTLNVVELPCEPPTGIDFPDVMELQVGEPFTVYDSCILPSGWTLEGEDPRIIVNGNSEEAWQHMMWVDETEDSATFMFDAPGSYPATVEWMISNISVYKDCLFRVADENGEYPLPQIRLEGFNDETFYLGKDQSAISYGLVNMDALSSLFEGDPVWSYELLSETDVKFYTSLASYESNSQWFDVFVEPDSPEGQISMKITATWDTVSASVIANCNVVKNPNGVPTGLAPIQTRYTITLGESITVPKPTFLPEGWTSGEEAYISCNCWEFPESVIITDQGDSFLVEFLNTGVFPLYLDRFEGGYSDFHELYVTVLDENGECEVPDFFCSANLTTAHAVAGKGLWLNISAYGGTHNYVSSELKLLKEDKVIKTYTDLTLPSWGKFLDVDLTAGEYDLLFRVVDTMGNVAESSSTFKVINAAPLAITSANLLSLYEPGVAECVVEYTGGSDVANISLYLYNKLNDTTPLRTVTYASSTYGFGNLPNGTYRVLVSISAGDEVVETFTNWFTIGAECDVLFAPNYYLMAPGTSYQLQLGGDMSNVTSIAWTVDDPSLGSIDQNGVFTSKTTGHALVTAHLTLTNGANVSVGADVNIIDYGSLVLPAALTTIEDEAFYGVPARRIVIPEGVTTIGSKAFAECGNLLLLEIPETVTSIADDILDGNDFVRIVCVEGSKAQIFAEAHGYECYLVK